MISPILVGLNPDKYTQVLCYCPFMVILDRCNVICSTLDHPSVKKCVTNKTEDVYLSVFNMITR